MVARIRRKLISICSKLTSQYTALRSL